MAPASIRASAPGKLMIMGEHAVVHGRQAIVAAVDQRVNVWLTPRTDDQVVVRSALGSHATTVGDLAPDPHSRFVIGALQAWQDALPSGCELTIEADFDNKVGLGSSAAVTAATLGSVAAWCEQELNLEHLLQTGLAVIRNVQGSGSGADLAASLYGGVLLYRAEPSRVKQLATSLPLTVVYSGIKAITPDVVSSVNSRRNRHAKLIDTVFDAMETSSVDAASAIQMGDWPRLGELFDINQGLMAALGVSTLALETILADLRRCPGIHGAKLSGAGMGDCLIGVGTTTEPPLGVLDLAVSADGLRVDA